MDDFTLFIKMLYDKHFYLNIFLEKEENSEIKRELMARTGFITKEVSLKERCNYLFQKKQEQHVCGCGCGTPILLENRFINGHARRSPEAKRIWQEKMTQTLIERYGEDYGQMRLKRAQATNLEKYGTICTFQNEDVKLKMKETMLERFGVDNPSKSPEIVQKKRETYEKNFGTKFNADLEINEKIRNTRHKTTYNRFIKFADKVIPLFPIEEFNGVGYDKEYQWRCEICKNEFKSYIYGSIPKCPICYPKAISKGHNELLKFIESIYSGKIINNDRKTIRPKEIDIYLPDLLLGIEFNGLYWHTEKNGKDKNYHLDKSELCKEMGIRLIHIFEDEWQNKQEIVKSKLFNLITKKSDRIFARNCKIVELSTNEKRDFLIINHIQGNDRASISYGLNYENTLVAVMTFGKSRYSMKQEYELMRFATLLNHVVIGAGNKLFHNFIKNHNPTSIVSYADLRWSTIENNLYEKLGFTYSHNSAPNYFYLNGIKRESRIKYQKHKLENLLENFDPNLSEAKNMEAAGFEKIWDCGNLVYVWNSLV